MNLKPLLPPLPTPRPSAPPVIVIGGGVEVVFIAPGVLRIDVTADDGVTRCTRFVTIEEARQLNVALTRLCR